MVGNMSFVDGCRLLLSEKTKFETRKTAQKPAKRTVMVHKTLKAHNSPHSMPPPALVLAA
jgi:hypothetical protein